ncbi:MAG: helix-turn-helix transcriptional regulator [Rhodospirillales bacterium]|jgi:DNA-binding CsgD family transcriptional regulator|nr:helix-turn-helix transcriptional regulator [Rhodospirillales bacterium]
MQAFHLSEVIQAQTLDSAWNAVVAVARDAGVCAVVETIYRPTAQDSGGGGTTLELARFHLDADLASPGTVTPATSGSPPPPTPRLGAPAEGDIGALPDDPDGLPVAVDDPLEARDPFAERFARALLDHHGICIKTILTVPEAPPTPDIAAQFLDFFATETLNPEAVSLLSNLAGAYVGRIAVLASRQESGRAVTLRPQEIECIRWAVAGKSIQDIADITGLSYRSVRYHIDQARERYGYASNLQTYIRASVDYGLDPLISPPNGRS